MTYQRLCTALSNLAALPGSALADDGPLAATGAAVWLPTGPYALHPATLNLLTPDSSLPWHLIRLGVQIRWGQFFTHARAHCIYPAQHPTCGLCADGVPETISHYFGGCDHPAVRQHSSGPAAAVAACPAAALRAVSSLPASGTAERQCSPPPSTP